MSSLLADRYLLCRPRGGLNDTLCRIEECWRYAERTHRRLVIDTAASSLAGLFTDYFEMQSTASSVMPVVGPALLERLNCLECRPACIGGRIGAYEAVYRETQAYVETRTGLPTRFCDARPVAAAPAFHEPLLVYDDCGGGTASLRLPAHLRFAPAIKPKLHRALARLGHDYVAVHVRNTDYRTDYVRLFDRIHRRVGRRVLLVCSDDSAVVRYAREVFAGPVVTASRREPSRHSTGAQHLSVAHQDAPARQEAAVDALIDLVCLANARRLYYAPVSAMYVEEQQVESAAMTYRELPAGPISGYSMLARHLCVRKDLLDAMLDVPAERRRRPDSRAAVEVCRSGTRIRRMLGRRRDRLKRIMLGVNAFA